MALLNLLNFCVIPACAGIQKLHAEFISVSQEVLHILTETLKQVQGDDNTIRSLHCKLGDYSVSETPDPIPNSNVKPHSANGTMS